MAKDFAVLSDSHCFVPNVQAADYPPRPQTSESSFVAVVISIGVPGASAWLLVLPCHCTTDALHP